MAIDRIRTARGALAGAVAASVWIAQQPLDQRVFGVKYDDAQLLGKAVTKKSPGWWLIGIPAHVANGALFGAVYANVARRVPLPSWLRGPAAGLTEHALTWPLVIVTDRVHPARDEMPKLSGSAAALAQATWRHFLFGLVMGELERRLNDEPDDELPTYEHVVSTNGHGNIEHAITGAA